MREPADQNARNQARGLLTMDRNSPGVTMAKSHGNVKNDRKYEALREKGYSKERSAKIANSGKKSSRKGGRNSH